jgi:hypothetical protein
MGETSSTYVGNMRHESSLGKAWVKDHIGHTGVEGSIVLKNIVEKLFAEI